MDDGLNIFGEAVPGVEVDGDMEGDGVPEFSENEQMGGYLIELDAMDGINVGVDSFKGVGFQGHVGVCPGEGDGDGTGAFQDLQMEILLYPTDIG